MLKNILDFQDKSVDKDGYATCPRCTKRVHCGPGGFPNLEKRHLGTKTCTEYMNQKDQKKTRNASILSFYKPKTSVIDRVPPTTTAPTRIGGVNQGLAELLPGISMPIHVPVPEAPTKSAITPSKDIKDISDRLRTLINSLPPVLGAQVQPDPLAMFNVMPESIDNPQISSEDLWEDVLNGMFKAGLGWGTSLDVKAVSQYGRAGLNGMANFVEYFVRKRGMSEALIEGKLAHLMEGLKSM